MTQSAVRHGVATAGFPTAGQFAARRGAAITDKTGAETAAETASMSIPAPYNRFEGEVLPEWIDYNGHMNLAYYTVLFDYATDLLFDELGLGLDYRRATLKGTFVAETHNR